MDVLPVSRTEKKEIKTVLLFCAAELAKKYAVIQLLHIKKEAAKIDYTIVGLSHREIQQAFASLPGSAKVVLQSFSEEALQTVFKKSSQHYKKQKAGLSQPAFLAQAMHRHIHQLFGALKPFYAELTFYHRIQKQGSYAFQTLSCTLSTERPRLRFNVIENKGLFAVEVEIGVQDFFYSAREFSRTAFFLQKESTYFVLSFSDYQTLEWLNGLPAAGLLRTSFSETVLNRLEEAYPVSRHPLLQEKTLVVTPGCRVLLSELNNTFLLLTPQWLYDGILVEGPWKERHSAAVGGEPITICRHAETEQAFLALLSSLHPSFAAQRNGYYYLSFADAQKKQWFIKTYYRLLEMEVEIAGMDMLHHFRYSPHKADTTLQVLREDNSRIYLHLSVCFGKEKVSPALLQKALFAGQRAIVLKDGSLGLLSDDWLEKYAILLKHGRLTEGALEVSKFLSFGEQQPAAIGQHIKQSWWALWHQWQTGTEPVFQLPPSINAQLRPYQQKGFEWLALLSQVGAGACLADDMGLGKTLQAICFLCWYHEQHPQDRHLIICPTSLLYNWQKELQKFAPALRTSIFHGSAGGTVDTDAAIVITSYGTLRSNGDLLTAQPFGVIVIDESHNIKNPSAQITRLVQQLEGAIRIALSGTPVVNNTFDLYAQLNFALPGLLGTREFFKREYADPIDRDADEKKIKSLQRLTAPFILRRTKEQVAADLPSRTETVLWCTMGVAQEELYNEIKEQVRSNLLMDIKDNGLKKTKLAVLQGLLKLRQICNHPQLLPQEEHGGRLQSAKTDMLMNELQHVLHEHKVLLFSQFSSMLQLLAAECNRLGITFFLLDGQTPAEKRAQMVENFQRNSEAPRLFLISLKAGNTGLTLTAADYVFLFDPWWNTAVEQQAVDRTHRIGQTKNVFAYKLVCKNTIEEKILELQQRKKRLADDLISAEEDFVKNLDEAEIAFLFE